MKIRCLPMIVLLSMAAAPLAGWAQASAPPPLDLSAASAPPSAKPGPRLMTPAEKRANANATGTLDARPEGRVTPQVSIPFGKKPPPPAPAAPRPAQGNPAANGIDDEAAKCEAQAGEQVRAKCRDKLARESKAR